MYLTIAVLVAVFFLFLFSQFGSRLPARHALIWWGVGVFILTASLWPGLFQRLAEALGMSLGSNLIFAGLILLLIFLLAEQGADLNRNQRLIRDLACTEAARAFLEKAGPRWEEKGAPRVLVVLPAYNEAESIAALARRLDAVAQGSPFALDYCFVDDGSTDGSPAVLGRAASHRFAAHAINLGVAGALLTGIKIAELRGAEFVVQCDADGQHPVEAIPSLVEEARRRSADLLIGSRYAPRTGANSSEAERGMGDVSSTPFRRMGGWIIALALKGFRLPARITDPTSGFRVYSRKAYQVLSRQMPDEYPEPESIALLSWAGMKIAEYGVPMSPRREGRSTIRGLRTLRYMSKVLGALLGLRLRMLFSGM